MDVVGSPSSSSTTVTSIMVALPVLAVSPLHYGRTATPSAPAAFAHCTHASPRSATFAKETIMMRKYLIERRLPGIGKETPEHLAAAAGKSNQVLRGLGTGVQWVNSYVTD